MLLLKERFCFSYIYRGNDLSSLLQPVEKATAEREREAERDRHSPFSQRHLHTHHHTHVGMGYPLIPGQYDPFQGQQLCPYAAFLRSALGSGCQNCLYGQKNNREL